MIAKAAQGDITTVAGSNHGDGGLAISASLSKPRGIAIDQVGNAYIADTDNHSIRKVAASNGTITTIAGTGVSGFSGDGGPAVDATLSDPEAVVLDGSGNLYIADQRRVRKLSLATGLITTVAGNETRGFSGDGGPATSASLTFVSSLAMDGSGNIYIADSGNYRIRKVTIATGLITTVAGTGVSGFAGDNGLAAEAKIGDYNYVAIDAAGNIYIADTGNYRIRKVTIATGKIATIAGTGVSGFSGDGGSAIEAKFSVIRGIAIDTEANIYVSDVSNSRVRKILAFSGTISTAIGSGFTGYSGDGGPATSASINAIAAIGFDAQGNIHLADVGVSVIRKVTIGTGVISTTAGSGAVNFGGDNGVASLSTLNNPKRVAFDSAGNMYIADTDNNRIRKVNAISGVITTIAGNGAFGFSGDGGDAISATLQFPIGIALDAAGNVYFTTTSQHLRKITVATGKITTVAGNGVIGFEGDGGVATNASLGNPLGIAIDTPGNVYIAEGYNARVRKVTAATGIITTITGGLGYGFSGDGGPATSAKNAGVSDVALDNMGNIYFTDGGNRRIRKITAATGIITTIAGTGTAGFSGDGGPATAANLADVSSIAIDKSGNIFFSGNTRIRKITASTGAIATVAGTGVQGFSGDGGPAINAQIVGGKGVSLDNADNLYIGDFNRVRKISGPIADSVLRLSNDLSADGKSDLLVQSGTGVTTAWLMNGTNITSGADLIGAGSGWTISHIADFNGDGKADILWRHTDGRIAMWLMNGTSLISGAGLLGAGSGWSVTHVADFNGDGRADILYRHTDGRIAMWLMDGINLISGAGLLGAGSGWSVTHVADFNGDGRADILYANTDGRIAMWLMNGTNLTAGAGLLGAGSGWSVTHTGDFDGDGRADILYRNTDGRIAMWLMDGTNLISGAGLLGAVSGWSVTHVADFNGDGKADILYANADGRIAMWLMNGTNLTAGAGLIGAGSGWSVTHTGDFNGDGKADIVYRHTDGRIAMWLMNGTNLTSGAGITGPGPLIVVPPSP